MDVKIAFLNRELEEELCKVEPEGFKVLVSEHKVCKLNKSSYGLKHSLS